MSTSGQQQTGTGRDRAEEGAQGLVYGQGGAAGRASRAARAAARAAAGEAIAVAGARAAGVLLAEGRSWSASQGVTVSRRRDCHSAAPPSPFGRRANRDGEGVPSK